MAVPPPSPDLDAPGGGNAADEKAALRGELRARRRDFAGDARSIGQLLAPLLARAGPFAGYIAHRGEPDILPFLLDAFDLGHAVALPHVERGTMHFRRWHPDMILEPGPLGIPQLVAGEPVAPAIILAPLVGFDRAGHRLGQGGGYYDRWFAAHPDAVRIGIAWSVQEVAALATEAWDMPLHAIVTEQEWIAP